MGPEEVAVCHTIYPLAQAYSLENVCCCESLVCGLWLLLHYPYWTLTETPLGYPAAALRHGGPAALVLQNQPVYTLQQLTDRVNVWWPMLNQCLISGLSQFSSPQLMPQGPSLMSPELALLCHPGYRWGQLPRVLYAERLASFLVSKSLPWLSLLMGCYVEV